MEGGAMKIICPQCNASYNIPNNKIPKKRAVATCKNCGGKIVIEPSAESHVEPLIPSEKVSVHHPDSSTAMETNQSTANAIFQDYPDLQDLSLEKFDFNEILSPKRAGGYKSRKNKFKVKILKAVSEILDKILKDGEKVVQTGKGTAYYPSEIFFGNGFLTMMYNHYAIVCTNMRLLFININSRINHPTHYLFQIPYEEIKKVKRGTFFSSMALLLIKGKRRTFTYVKRYISKELKQVIMEKKEGMKPLEHSNEFLENLCPSCFVPLKKGLVNCPYCKVNFKEARKASLKSLLLPGLGDIYLGHRALGILELIGSAIVWIIVISSLLSGVVESLIGAFFLLLFYNGIDGLLTYHMAKKGYMLAKK